MLDIKFIRENAELVKEAARKKHINFDVAKLLEADDLRLKILKEVEEMRARQNAASDNIAKIQNAEERQKVIAEMKDLKEKLLAKVEELRKANGVWRELMFLVPNIPDVSVPEGENDAQNAEIKKWGEIPDFKAKGFEPKSHIELMQKLDMADFERGAKVSGFRGYFLKNDGALFVFCHMAIRPGIFYEKGRIFADDCAVFSKKGDNVRDRFFASRRRRPLSHSRQRISGRDSRSVRDGLLFRRNFGQKDLPKNFCASRRASEGKPAVMGKMSKGLSGSMNFISWNKLFCAKPNIKSRSSGTNGSIETRKNLWSL